LQPSPFRNTFVEIMKTGYGPCLMWSSCWHVRQMCAMRRKQSPALVTSNAAQPHSGPWDGLVGRADDTMRRGAVHFPELFGKLRLVVLQSLGCPRLEGWQAHLLWLSGAVWACAGLGEVLLVVVLAVVEDTAVLLVVGGGCALGRDGPAERLLVRRLAAEDQLLLLVVKPVRTAPVCGRDGIAQDRRVDAKVSRGQSKAASARPRALPAHPPRWGWQRLPCTLAWDSRSTLP